MSIKTWKDEFYPVHAREVNGEEAAILHSLRKWEGLRAENLAKHGLVRGRGWSLKDGDDEHAFSVSAVSCSLCAAFLDDEPPEGGSECWKCPLFRVQGAPCCEGDDNPFDHFFIAGDAEPMIALIRSALGASEGRAK